MIFYNPEISQSFSPNIFGRDSIRNPWNEFIHSIAKKHHATLIDLDKLFDPYDRSHYGATEIEPSDKTNEMMAKVIKSIVKRKST